MATQTFPGVYTSVTDNSFDTNITSRFRGGLVGVAEKGPFNQAVQVGSFNEYVFNFGKSVTGSYLPNAAQVVAELSDGLSVVRVGHQYDPKISENASGAAGAYTLISSSANLLTPGDYARISQIGKATTPNARIESISGSTITLVSVGGEAKALADDYDSADVDTAITPNGANEAEAFAYSRIYSDPVAGLGQVIGDKNAYSMTITGDINLISVGSILSISQANRVTTNEIMVKSITPATLTTLAIITFQSAVVSEQGYVPIALQDSYTQAVIKVATGYKLAAQLIASTAGTWANSDGSRTGLICKVSPGSTPGTKKITSYWDSSVSEVIDNLSEDPTSANYYETAINGLSKYISIKMLVNEPLANTMEPWNTVIFNNENVIAFSGGYNGENVTVDDFIGSVDPVNDTPTGLKVFEDDDNNTQVDIIYCPGISDISVGQEMVRICNKINAACLMDIPIGLNAREATDWHNGEGLYTGLGKIDSYRLKFLWNWGGLVDAYSGVDNLVPPGIGQLRCIANTYDKYTPWMVAAGDNRGYIPEFTRVQFTKISESVKNQMYGGGNFSCVNPIILHAGRIEVFGDRSAQRAESKLTQFTSVLLVNYILRTLSVLGRKYLFDPIDSTTLTSIELDFRSLLQVVASERGLKSYDVVINGTNNNLSNFQNRQLNADISIVPYDTLERLFINAFVNSSGATLNSVV